MSKKNSVKLKAAGEQELTPEQVENLENKLKVDEKPETIVNRGVIASMVDYPVTVRYGDKSIRISGRAREFVADISLLEQPEPKGLKYQKSE